MTIGKCDRCYAPGSPDTEVYTSTFDDGGGTMHMQTLCAKCGGIEAALGDVASHLAILGLGKKAGGVDLPASFFGPSGSLLPPPWAYGETRIFVHVEPTLKRATIAVPVSSLAALSFVEANKLAELTAVLATLFAKVAPAGWTVHS